MSWIFGAAKLLMSSQRVKETAGLLSSGVATARQYMNDFNRTHFSYMWQEANQGEIESQYQLAECYFKGQGIDKSLEDAALWYSRAAQAGHARAQCNLAMMKFLGQGTTKDPIDAWMWMFLALTQNDLSAVQAAPSLRARIDRSDCDRAEQNARNFQPKIYIFSPDETTDAPPAHQDPEPSGNP